MLTTGREPYAEGEWLPYVPYDLPSLSLVQLSRACYASKSFLNLPVCMNELGPEPALGYRNVGLVGLSTRIQRFTDIRNVAARYTGKWDMTCLLLLLFINRILQGLRDT